MPQNYDREILIVREADFRDTLRRFGWDPDTMDEALYDRMFTDVVKAVEWGSNVDELIADAIPANEGDLTCRVCAADLRDGKPHRHFRLLRDITAAEMAMEGDGEEGYKPSDVIGPAGSLVRLDPNGDGYTPEDRYVEVCDFANDPFASGFVPLDALEPVSA